MGENKMKKIKKQKGFTVLEITFVLGIMAILGGLTFNELRYTIELQRGHEAVSKMRGIYIAALQYYTQNQRTFQNISMSRLCTEGYLDNDTCGATGNAGVGRGPWGGDYKVFDTTSSEGANTFMSVGIGVTKVPYQGGNFIVTELKKDLNADQTASSYDFTNATAGVVYYSSN